MKILSNENIKKKSFFLYISEHCAYFGEKKLATFGGGRGLCILLSSTGQIYIIISQCPSYITEFEEITSSLYHSFAFCMEENLPHIIANFLITKLVSNLIQLCLIRLSSARDRVSKPSSRQLLRRLFEILIPLRNCQSYLLPSCQWR